MRVRTIALLLATHLAAGAAGFAGGVYVLPILTAPPPASAAELDAVARVAAFRGRFERDLQDSDPLHWGEGEVFIGAGAIAIRGRLAPGPDYRLYLSPRFVETESDFLQMKDRMQPVGPVRSFGDQVLALPAGVDPSQFDSVIIWCEAFGQFITAARYRP